jgi:hypothetical protein
MTADLPVDIDNYLIEAISNKEYHRGGAEHAEKNFSETLRPLRLCGE